MRATLVLAGIALGVCFTSFAAAQQDFVPYTAYVQTDLAPVYSGPGPESYATDALARGSRIRVYRHDRSGWCAIRPPDGSFSWVQSDKLQASSESDVVQVTAKDAISYVGTRFGDDHDAQHVRLKPGELVEILATSTLEGSPGRAGALWAKIMPPAGEFRWIHSEYIAKTRPGPVDEVVQAHQQQSGSGDLSVGNQPAQAAAVGDWVAVTPALPEASLAAYQSELGVANSVGPAPPVAVAAGVPQLQDQEDGVETARRSWRPGAQAFRDTTLPIGSSDLKTQELIDVDVRLSQAVSQDVSLWELDDLQSRVEAVIDTSGQTRQRDQARNLLGVIVQFQDIKRRHQRLTGSHIGSLDLAQGRVSDPTGAEASGSESLYDGTGWLMPVVTQRNGIPRYALTDRNGRILQFVTPSPGVNLRRFEREQIGIIGRRGYVPRLRTPHLMAERVVVLNRHRR